MHQSTPQPILQPLSSLLCIEIFAGSCRLSQALSATGFQASAVDHNPCGQFKVFILDLTCSDDQNLVLDLIRQCKPFLVWLAPPCGTASRAKEIPAYDASGRAISKPLRATAWPDGVPFGICAVERARIEAANALYAFTQQVVESCETLTINWVVENPLTSLFWSTSFFHAINARHNSVFFQPCMFGGDRPKKTKLLFGGLDLSSLQVECDQQHSHKPWRQNTANGPIFLTSEERAYPTQFCTAFATLLQSHALSLGFSVATSLSSPCSDPLKQKTLLAANVGKQRRGRQLALLPSTFQEHMADLSQMPASLQPNSLLLHLLTKAPVSHQSLSLMMGLR